MEIPGQYPRHMVFNVFGEDNLKRYNIQMNQDYTVSFDIDAREYQGRWFNDIRAYNVIRGQVPQAVNPTASPFPPAQGQPDAATSPFPPAQEPAAEGGSADDLPF